jgi:hypothetical protein
MAIKPCRECGAKISTRAAKCPHCGVRLRRRHYGLYFIVLLLGAFIAFAIWIDRRALTELPSCDASNAVEMVKKTLDDAPAGKVLGIKIIDFQNAREVSRSATEVQCAATVKLNNATTGELSYRFYIENGKIFVQAQLPGF